MIQIRADGNSQIGAGHIMRCLSVAMALKKLGEEVWFVLADESCRDLVESRGYRVHVLGTDYRQMEGELDSYFSFLKHRKPAGILVDSYFVTEKYLNKLREITKVAYLDDMFERVYPVDIIINYGICAEELPYKEKYPRTTKCLLGPYYAPVRQEFQDREIRFHEALTDVLITTGGSDAYNLAGGILQEALQDEYAKTLKYHVVSGAFNTHLKELQKLEKNYSNVTVYSNVKRMSDIMLQCDVALTAGGSTVLELSALGIPFLCFSFVDNQEPGVQALVKKDLTAYGGNYLTEKERMIKDLIRNLKLLGQNNSLRNKYARKIRECIDGNGAMHIAQEILESLLETPKTLLE